MIEGFHEVDTPADGLLRMASLDDFDGDHPFQHFGLVDVQQDRSIQIGFMPIPWRLFGRRKRPRVMKMCYACEPGLGWPILADGSALVDLGQAGPNQNDMLLPIRAAGDDLMHALEVLASQRTYTIPATWNSAAVTMQVESNDTTLRIELSGAIDDTTVMLAPADITEAQIIPPAWPPLLGGDTGLRRAISDDHRVVPPASWRDVVGHLKSAGGTSPDG